MAARYLSSAWVLGNSLAKTQNSLYCGPLKPATGTSILLLSTATRKKWAVQSKKARFRAKKYLLQRSCGTPTTRIPKKHWNPACKSLGWIMLIFILFIGQLSKEM